MEMHMIFTCYCFCYTLGGLWSHYGVKSRLSRKITAVAGYCVKVKEHRPPPPPPTPNLQRL